MENEFLTVAIQSNGTLTVTHKSSGRRWEDLGYFRDSSEIGNPWEHVPVASDAVFTTLNEQATISLVCSGELVTSYRVELDWALPSWSLGGRDVSPSGDACPIGSSTRSPCDAGNRGSKSRPR